MTGHEERTAKRGATRRTVLWSAGAVTVLAAGGIVWRGLDRGAFTTATGPAYEPWETWNDPAHDGTPLALAAAAILSSNAHNTQPWMFKVEDGAIGVLADRSRNLGNFDPYLREMHLSLGCALETMSVAAPAHGFTAAIQTEDGRLTAEGDRGGFSPVAVVRLTPSAAAPHAFHDAIPRRHTHRGPYDREHALPDEAVRAFHDLAQSQDVRLFLFTDGADRERFDTLTVEATQRIITDAPMAADSDAWFRLTRDEVERHRDGVTLDAAGLPGPIRVAAKLLPRMSAEQTNQSWLMATRDVHLATAPVTGILAVRDPYDLRAALAAGRAWQRLHLWATTQGIAMQPVNQAAEIADRERQTGADPAMGRALADLLGTQDWRPTFLFRAGYPAAATYPSPRRPLPAVVM